MKICVYGLGAVGGLIAAKLAASGTPTNAIARGATLEAVRRGGLRLTGHTTEHVHINVTDQPEALGEQDLVILSVKNTGLLDAASRIAPLLGPNTAVLSTMNGVPWWFGHGLHIEGPGLQLGSVDPEGAITRAIPVDKVIGCVTHLSASTPAAGIVECKVQPRLIIGEPTGGADTERCKAVIAVMRTAGFEVESSPRIQQTVWFKLWGNMTVNPISAITGATGDLIVGDPLVRDFMTRCMLEAAEVGKHMGLPIDADPEARHDVTRHLGAFRTSMLQDVESGRQVELDAIVGAVTEIARGLGVATPYIDALFGMARLHARCHGLYR